MRRSSHKIVFREFTFQQQQNRRKDKRNKFFGDGGDSAMCFPFFCVFRFDYFFFFFLFSKRSKIGKHAAEWRQRNCVLNKWLHIFIAPLALSRALSRHLRNSVNSSTLHFRFRNYLFDRYSWWNGSEASIKSEGWSPKVFSDYDHICERIIISSIRCAAAECWPATVRYHLDRPCVYVCVSVLARWNSISNRRRRRRRCAMWHKLAWHRSNSILSAFAVDIRHSKNVIVTKMAVACMQCMRAIREIVTFYGFAIG